MARGEVGVVGSEEVGVEEDEADAEAEAEEITVVGGRDVAPREVAKDRS
jgi:hypothetical protein